MTKINNPIENTLINVPLSSLLSSPLNFLLTEIPPRFTFVNVRVKEFYKNRCDKSHELIWKDKRRKKTCL